MGSLTVFKKLTHLMGMRDGKRKSEIWEKNVHSSEKFSGEWAVLYNGILYMSLATFSMEVAIF